MRQIVQSVRKSLRSTHLPAIALAGAAALAFPAPSDAADKIICIDPGHGGTAPSGTMEARTLSSPNNARTPSGLLEKDLTMELSQLIVSELRTQSKAARGSADIRLTRSSDENPDFQERARRCLGNGEKPNLIVSIHFNASERHDARGSVGMIAARDHNDNYERDHELARRLAEASARGVSACMSGAAARAPISDGHLHGGKGSNFFFQLKKIPQLRSVPVCFLEIEFIDRADVDEKLIQKKSRTFPLIAAEIARELLAF